MRTPGYGPSLASPPTEGGISAFKLESQSLDDGLSVGDDNSQQSSLKRPMARTRGWAKYYQPILQVRSECDH